MVTLTLSAVVGDHVQVTSGGVGMEWRWGGGGAVIYPTQPTPLPPNVCIGRYPWCWMVALMQV